MIDRRVQLSILILCIHHRKMCHLNLNVWNNHGLALKPNTNTNPKQMQTIEKHKFENFTIVNDEIFKVRRSPIRRYVYIWQVE